MTTATGRRTKKSPDHAEAKGLEKAPGQGNPKDKGAKEGKAKGHDKEGKAKGHEKEGKAKGHGHGKGKE